jgi:pumilio family protein 6
LDLGYAVRAYKTLLAGGRFSTTSNAVEEQDAELQSRFAQLFFDNITSSEAGGAQNLVNIALGNATFALIELLAALKEDKKRIGTMKQTLCKPEVLSSIESGWRKGAKPLYEALSKL